MSVFILQGNFQEGWTWDSSVHIVTTLWVGQQWNHGSLPGMAKKFAPSQSIQPSIKWVPKPFPSG